MIKALLQNIATINWIVGMILMLLSNIGLNQTGIKSKHEGKLMGFGFSINDIKSAIKMAEDEAMKSKLKQKIFFRRIAWLLLFSTPILIFLANV